MELTALRAALRGLSAYRELKELPVMAHMVHLLDHLAGGQGEDTESPYALLAERGGADPALENAARRDVGTLVLLAQTDCDRYIGAMKALLSGDWSPALAGLPRWSATAPFDFDSLTQFYREHGAGLYARYRAFLWEDGQLIPVADPDCPQPQDLLGYELQREQVEQNTRLLLSGRQANNVLLFGDGGTGKSATVKSMLYLPGMEDLRLIEIQAFPA